jgi:DNA repair protein SbcC/Rad50
VRAATVRQSLAEQEAELPGDVADLRRESAELEAEHAALRSRLTGGRAQVRQEQDLLDRRTGERQALSQQLADKDRQLHEQQIRRQGFRETVAAALSSLPAAWQLDAAAAGPADLERWQTECKHLEERGLAAQLQELQGARQELEVLRQRKAELERGQEEVPAEARCAPAHFGERIRAARQEQAAREVGLGEIREEGIRLAQRRQQRQELRRQFREADRQHILYRTLSEHLGRKGLQLHLMRQAERGIIDFANTVLDRLSGGQYCLRLRGEESGDDTEQALQLEAYDRRRGQVFGLPFLSGSQRFRVAVSLALGVGQYASRQHRPIESVIIDEGFGCLDREGRQVMIQELLNLRSQLRCILLVSHQEEFADAFADCYRFELAGGTTAVTRWQR